jgi:hypothetical protein
MATVVTASAHGLRNGEKITVASVNGNVHTNYCVRVLDADRMRQSRWYERIWFRIVSLLRHYRWN